MSNESTPASDPTFTMDDVFGDLSPGWVIAQHTERFRLNDAASIAIQTSHGQRATDANVGTWNVQVFMTGNNRPLMSTHFPWCPLPEARTKALEWARIEIRKMTSF